MPLSLVLPGKMFQKQLDLQDFHTTKVGSHDHPAKISNYTKRGLVTSFP